MMMQDQEINELFVDKPDAQPALGIWNEFEAYFGEREFIMARSVSFTGGWYARTNRDGASIECVRAIRFMRDGKAAK